MDDVYSKSCHSIVLLVSECSMQGFHMDARIGLCEWTAAFGVFNQCAWSLICSLGIIRGNSLNDTVMHHPDVAHTCCLSPRPFKIAMLP